MHPIERLRYVARSHGLEPGTLAFEAADALADLSFDPQALVISARRLLEAHLDCGPLWWVTAHILAADEPVVAARSLANELLNDPTIDELAAALPGAAHVVMAPVPSIIAASNERPDLTIDLIDIVGREYAVTRALRALPNGNAVSLDELPSNTDAIAIVPLCAASASGYLLTEHDAEFVVRAKASGIAVWATAGVGCILPAPLFVTCARRLGCGEETHVGASKKRQDHLDGSWRKLELDAIDVVVGPDGPFLPTPQAFRTTCPTPGELRAL